MSRLSQLVYTPTYSSTAGVFANPTPYPAGRLHRATNFITMFDTTLLPYNVPVDGCNNTFCYTSSKGTFIYKPHSDIGMVGRSAAGYLAQRKRM